MLTQPLFEMAQKSGCIDREKCLSLIEQAIEHQESPVHAVLDAKLVSEESFLHELSEFLSMPWWNEDEAHIPTEVRDAFPIRVAARHALLPLRGEDGGLRIYTSDPFDLVSHQAVAQVIDEEVEWGIAPRGKILECLREGYGVGADTFEQIIEGGGGSLTEDDNSENITILDEDDTEASIVRFVNQIIREALQQRATDIHIEPLDEDIRIRYRIDGVLNEIPVPPKIKLLRATLISRLKIMSNLDIAERRLPQDGRINLELEGQAIDVRVATIPSIAGESISLRLLRQERFEFESLGIDADDERIIRELIALPNGILLITGPTGSGKSTSLYTFLSALNTKDRRIVTVEDPVEYKLPGVVQIAVKPEIKLTFASGLRSILRGDPNVIMVGEMRDFETAETAIRAALTGHLVFSTLHTNDAVGGITRLIDLGLEPYLVASSVRAFIAQRLVRVLCKNCRKPTQHSKEYLKEIGYEYKGSEIVYDAGECAQCRHTGYTGRTAIYEICMVSPKMQDLITQNRPTGVLKEQALRQGMHPLRHAGFRKVTRGVTTIEEVLRVTMVEGEKEAEQ
jgi:general secretion pathway protein E